MSLCLVDRSDLPVAAIQVSSGANLQANLGRCTELVEQAAGAGARLILLPENFAFFGPEKEKAEHAEDRDEPGLIQTWLARQSARLGVTLVGGGMPLRSPDPARPYNACVVFGSDGQRLAIYEKLHLFDVELPDGTVMRESANTMAGDRAVLIDVDGFRVGLCICYDLRFPLLFDALSQAGAEVFLVPAAFTQQTGVAHWHVLLRARAIEWQSWVVAAAQWGEHPGDRKTYGHSLVCDPWGSIVSECLQGDGVCVATLDKAKLDEVRARLPCLLHQRRDLVRTDTSQS